MKKKKVLILLAVAAVALTLRYYAPARVSAWVLLGRSQSCPFSNALQSEQELAEQIRKKDEILAASRLIVQGPKGYRHWETPDGNYWVPNGSDYSLPYNLAEQARNIYGRNGRGVKPGDIVLDCGANVGVFTRASLKAGAKLVVAIEPAPENIECLRRNFAEQVAAGRVIVYPKGVWDKDDFLELHVDPHNSAADSFVIDREGWRKVEKVPLTTIDKLVEELKLERVDFIKMDIEGAETRAIQGGKGTLARFKPRMAISAYHQVDDPKNIPQVVREGWPDYKQECGPCAETRFGVRPDILYFFP
jgi:FkbM family methyltransferase